MKSGSFYEFQEQQANYMFAELVALFSMKLKALAIAFEEIPRVPDSSNPWL